mmetsp:Transcript_47037/g.142428  ORF Transcript_47037/g.142428 Transcript_47037/m.142428 type:complete len:117 (+) Transcript_47037:1799-2149(+)
MAVLDHNYKCKANWVVTPRHGCTNMVMLVVTCADNHKEMLGTTFSHVGRVTLVRSLSNRDHSLGLNLLNGYVCETSSLQKIVFAIFVLTMRLRVVQSRRRSFEKQFSDLLNQPMVA